MERLLAGDAQGVSIWVVGTEVLCWVPGKADLDAVDARLAVLTAFVDAIPRFVWLDHGHDPGPAAAAPVPEPGLPARVPERVVVSAAARATRRHGGRTIVTVLALVVASIPAIALTVMGLPELARLPQVVTVVVVGSIVARWLIAYRRRTAARARSL